MSTKIHHGLILRGAHLDDALRLLVTLRQKAVDIAQRGAARRAARLISLERDLAENYCQLPRSSGRYGIFDAVRVYQEARIQVLGRQERNVDWDFTLDVTLIPHHGDVLALYYAERHSEYRPLLLGAGFADFSYQNSTDARPEGVSEQEYEARGFRWDAALPGRSTPACAGLQYQVVRWDDYHPALLSREMLAAGLPTPEERARRASMALTELGPGFPWAGMRITAMVRRLEAEEPLRRPTVILTDAPLF